MPEIFLFVFFLCVPVCSLSAFHIMSRNLHYVYPNTRVRSIVRMLRTTAHSAFPVVTKHTRSTHLNALVSPPATRRSDSVTQSGRSLEPHCVRLVCLVWSKMYINKQSLPSNLLCIVSLPLFPSGGKFLLDVQLAGLCYIHCFMCIHPVSVMLVFTDLLM